MQSLASILLPAFILQRSQAMPHAASEKNGGKTEKWRRETAMKGM